MSKLVKRVENSQGIEILTPSGYQKFSGIVKHETECVKITLRSGSFLECSLKHPIVDSLEIRRADTFVVGDELLTTNGIDIVDNIESLGIQTVYDPTDVEGGNLYLANGVFVNHNCQFLSSDPLLINTLTLSMMKSKTPLYNDKGFFFWKEPDPNKSYIVGVDVAEGMQQDFSTIQVIELETLEQIAEYRNNTVKENQLYDAIKYIITKLLNYVEPRTGKRPSVYWSFENNSAGAALGALYYNDEKFPAAAELISGKETRLGFRTVNKTKVEACRYLKKLIEQTRGGLTINSKMMIFELKNFVATGAGYAAKRGSTDDLICAFLIVLRVMKYLSDYEPEVFDKLYKSEGEFYEETSNDYDDPVPFVV